ncbi:MAG: PASTA domain-containing protein [Thermoanaerobaculia bacterium]|nr:PASTA domain-containing protein [Thermoanaerobaculia bacterium]
MLRRLLRALGWTTYALGLLAVFVLAGYSSFNLFVRRGVTTVPDLQGVEESEARRVLADAGLKMRLDNQVYDETVPGGHVVRQEPTGGGLVKRGSPVGVVLSSGPEVVRMPQLRGTALRAAQVALSAADLTLASTASVYSERGLPGTVVEQSPPPGAEISRSTPVRLFLCKEGRAATFLMPDLVYREYDEVRAFFERRGLRLGSVKYERYEGIAAGVVLRQFPVAGHPLRQGEVISLVVAGGEAGA